MLVQGAECWGNGRGVAFSGGQPANDKHTQKKHNIYRAIKCMTMFDCARPMKAHIEYI